MDEVVAVEVTLASGVRHHFLTWGRIQDGVDPRPLAELVLAHANASVLAGTAISARVCRSLKEAADAPYFFECLLGFSLSTIPFGAGYERWRTQIAREMSEGRQIAYCGDPADAVRDSGPDAIVEG